MKNKFLKLFFMLFLPLLFISGCSAENELGGLKWLNEKAGDFLRQANEKQKAKVIDVMDKKGKGFEKGEKEQDQEEAGADDITRAQKDKIDAWLEERGLNRYGDDKSAVYTGGTPLFNEETGERIDRYDYILNKFPDILEKIKE